MDELKKYNRTSFITEVIILGVWVFIILTNLISWLLYGDRYSVSGLTAAILTFCWGYTGYSNGVRRGKEKIMNDLLYKLMEDDEK